MTALEGEYYNKLADKTAQEMGWPNDESLQAANWFCLNAESYHAQLEMQPTSFLDTQEDVKRWEEDIEDYVIDLEEYANTGGFTATGDPDDVDWDIVADYLLAIEEHRTR